MKHTEGPWKVQTTDGPDLTIWNDKECIATVWMNSDTASNAKLIAAAPEMLEKLIAIHKDFYLMLDNVNTPVEDRNRIYQMIADSIQKLINRII